MVSGTRVNGRESVRDGSLARSVVVVASDGQFTPRLQPGSRTTKKVKNKRPPQVNNLYHETVHQH